LNRRVTLRYRPLFLAIDFASNQIFKDLRYTCQRSYRKLTVSRPHKLDSSASDTYIALRPACNLIKLENLVELRRLRNNLTGSTSCLPLLQMPFPAVRLRHTHSAFASLDCRSTILQHLAADCNFSFSTLLLLVVARTIITVAFVHELVIRFPKKDWWLRLKAPYHLGSACMCARIAASGARHRVLVNPQPPINSP
jgi:hypothetical protein